MLNKLPTALAGGFFMLEKGKALAENLIFYMKKIIRVEGIFAYIR
jgi:hypothetical protein